MNNTASREGYDQAELNLQEANRLGNPKKMDRAETRLIQEYAMAYNEAFWNSSPSGGIEYLPEEFDRTPIEKIQNISYMFLQRIGVIFNGLSDTGLVGKSASREGYEKAEQLLIEATRFGDARKLYGAEIALIQEYAMAYNEAYSGDNMPSDGIKYQWEEFYRTPIENIVGIINFVVNEVRNIYAKV